ncbi:MAG: endo-1,4-beta-xylanase, partial [Draconibacterium sp.]|nr:endo-1,4-beta-xylanase [Draconibacterium sp.]
QEGVFNFEDADKLVKLGEENNMFVVGHTLVWHSQTPDWLFTDENGKDVSREVLIERMRKHIYTVVGRYKGRVHGWDVVNEAINGPDGWRNTKWKQIIGKEYFDLAFQFAHEADPGAELYYNDYNMHLPEKRKAAVRLIQRLQNKGIPIHGVGMQAHYSLDTDLKEVEKSIKAYSQLGVKVMLTEIDISVLPRPSKRMSANVTDKFEYQKKLNPYINGLPDSVQKELAKKYESLFKILLKHEDVVSRATFWGLNDGVSWKNNFPVKGRTNYPLLFDRKNNPKPAYHAVINLVK